MKISQNFVTFSEYLNFKTNHKKSCWFICHCFFCQNRLLSTYISEWNFVSESWLKFFPKSKLFYAKIALQISLKIWFGTNINFSFWRKKVSFLLPDKFNYVPRIDVHFFYLVTYVIDFMTFNWVKSIVVRNGLK